MTSRGHFTRIPSASSSASTTIADTNYHAAVPQHVIPSAAPSTIRRNLFHAHLSRRQHTSSAPNTASHHRAHPRTVSGNGDGSGLSSALGTGFSRTRVAPGTLGLANGASMPVVADGNDIVVRDKNGSYKVDIPILQPGVDEDGGDPMVGVENGGVHTALDHDGGISAVDKEKFESTIAEMMRRNRSRQMNGEPSEVYLLIQQSLKDKVASLEEDKWMFEVDNEARI